MKKKLVFWVEEYFYNPKTMQKILSFLLLPLSYIYCFIIYLRYRFTKGEDLGIVVVSVGNLTVGGSGKTPLVTALAGHYENSAIVLRGYGRKTKGLCVVKDQTSIVCNVSESGDEAMMYAHKLPHAI
ncbi:MAG: tetraacyldisaccharide 4'-kinase, partial [Sulfurimonadaceae bacterium]|nr:tetraacyldisaccharide 4'-kinase [Sulfurimonadaceae bacterium]